MARTRRSTGHKPGKDWDLLGTVVDGVRWLVYQRKAPGSEWSTIKVVADGRVASKANYWLGWNGSRFGRQSDLFTLLMRPALFAAVTEMLGTQAEGHDLL